MTDKKFTDEEIVELLRAYVERQCGKCNVKDLGTCCGSCFITAISQAADLINRQRAEIERLQHKYELAGAEREANVKGFTETLEKQRVEIERLKNINKKLDGFVLEARAEGIKEFAERVKEGHRQCDGEEDVPWLIDKLVKEMAEECTE
jgi:predicted RNase H-like nuclease (RuvC/YqgF family)